MTCNVIIHIHVSVGPTKIVVVTTIVASGSRSHYSRDHHSSGGSDRDRDVDDDVASRHPSNQSRFEELNSLLRSEAGLIGTVQGGQSVKRPLGPPGPGA